MENSRGSWPEDDAVLSVRPASAAVRQIAGPGDVENQMIPMAGERFGPYEILGTLGRGGVGEVYRAWHSRLEREVAIKLLHDDYPQATSRERFLIEGRAASALNHPNICTIFDMGEKDGSPYLVMELLKGETLKQRIERGGMGPEEIAHYGMEIAEALDSAHAMGVVHRDVKPANIMLVRQPDGRARVKVLDFGLAKITGALAGRLACGEDHLTVPGEAVGTVSYMSPEQARGDELDGRSDLFSLGTVMYEMATRRTPFQGSTTPLLFVQLLNEDPEPIRDWNEDVPRALEKVIFRMLEKEPGKRYQTGAEVSAVLSGFAGKSSGSRWRRPAPPVVPLVRVEEPVARAGLPIRPDLRRDGIGQGVARAGNSPAHGVRRASAESAIRPVRLTPALEAAGSGSRGRDGYAAGIQVGPWISPARAAMKTPRGGVGAAVARPRAEASPGSRSGLGTVEKQPRAVPSAQEDHDTVWGRDEVSESRAEEPAGRRWPDSAADTVVPESPVSAEDAVSTSVHDPGIHDPSAGQNGVVLPVAEDQVSSAESLAASEPAAEVVKDSEPDSSGAWTEPQDTLETATAPDEHARNEAALGEDVDEWPPVRDAAPHSPEALEVEWEPEPDESSGAIALPAFSEWEAAAPAEAEAGLENPQDGADTSLNATEPAADTDGAVWMGRGTAEPSWEARAIEPRVDEPAFSTAVWAEDVYTDSSDETVRAALAGIRAAERQRVRRMQAVWAAVAGLVCIASGAVARYAFRPKLPLLAPGERVAVAAIENRTGAQMLDGSVAAGLEFALAQNPDLTVESGQSYGAALRALSPDGRPVTAEVARQAAQAAGAGAYLYGDVAQLDGGMHGSGAGYRLSAVVRDAATDRELARAEADAERVEDVPGAIDKLAESLARGLHPVPRPGIGYVPLAREATGSLSALHLYAAAAQAEVEGRHEAALKAYGSATAIDSGFVQALLRMTWLARSEDAARASADAADRAAAASQGRSARTVMLAQAAQQANSRGDLEGAALTARQATAAKPQDADALLLLARVERLGGHYAEALSLAKRDMIGNPRSPELYEEAELSLTALNRAGEAAELEDQAAAAGLARPSFSVVTEYLAGKNQTGPAARWAESAGTAEPDLLTARAIYLDNSGSMTDGTDEWTRAADGVRGHSALVGATDALLARAALNRALAGRCDDVLPLTQSIGITETRDADIAVRAGVAAGLCGDAVTAQAAEDVLTSSAAAPAALPEVRTARAIGRGDGPLALQAAQGLIGADPVLLAPYLRSMAHLLGAEPGAAIADAEDILAHRGVVVSAGTNLYPMAQLELARAFAASGDRENSTEAYARFAELWGGATPADALKTEASNAQRGVLPKGPVLVAHAAPAEMARALAPTAADRGGARSGTQFANTPGDAATPRTQAASSASEGLSQRWISAGRVAARPVVAERHAVRTDLPASWFASPPRTVLMAPSGTAQQHLPEAAKDSELE